MRRRLLLLLPLLTLLCAAGVVTYGLTRPRAFNLLAGYYVAYTAVASDACLFEGDQVAGSYQVYGVHTLSDGFIIFYAVECSVPGQPNKIYDGDRKYQLRGLRWTGVGRGMRGHALLPAGTLADYQVSLGDERVQPYTYLTGEVLTSTVTTVVVTFADGTIHHAAPNQGRFSALTLHSVMACRLDLLDARDQLVQTYDLEVPPPAPAAFGVCAS